MEVLAQAAAGQQWLLVLDDLWSSEHERMFNFIDPVPSPEARVFATSRFAKLLVGYVEVPLGLLSEDEAVALLLGTAEVAQPSTAHLAASKIVVKQCGAFCV